jgi:peptidoglycan/LPS O-acetylase OafA/YrhL
MLQSVKPAQAQANTHAYFRAVDGLRALAVLAVMIYHLTESGLPGGFVGVDIFFVISGFVVTNSIHGRDVGNFLSFLSYFYARRIVRILPALTVCLLVTSAGYVLFIPRGWLSTAVAWSGLASFFGVNNIYLAFNTDGYFTPRATYNPFTHTWSLGVEEQFYLLFPFLIYPLSKLRARLSHRAVLLSLVAALCAISVVFCAHFTTDRWAWAYYMIPARFWELGVGMLLCLTMDWWKPRLAALNGRAAAAFAIMAVLLVVQSLAFMSKTAFPFPLGIPPVIGTLGLIALCVARPDNWVAGPFAHPATVYVGKISYSLYLWHWPVYVMMRWTVGLETALQFASAFVISLALGALSYAVVERPVTRWRARSGLSSPVVVIIGVTVTVMACGGAAVAFKEKENLTLSRTGEEALWYPDNSDGSPGACLTGSAVQATERVKMATWTSEACSAPGQTGRLVVAGDSHADAFDRMVRAYGARSGRDVVVYSMAGCSFLKLADHDPQRAECRAAEAYVAKALLADLTPQDILFLPSMRMPRMLDDWGGVPQVERDPWTAADQTEAEDLIRRLAGTGAAVVFEGPLPMFNAPPYRCSDWFNRGSPRCSAGLTTDRAMLEARRALPLQRMHSMAAQIPGVTVWDPFPLLCGLKRCDAVAGGKPNYFDGDHLSAHGNDVLRPSFTEALNRCCERGVEGRRQSMVQ